MNTFENNRLLMTDSYKMSHFLQYPEDVRTVFSYIESRGGEYDEAVLFGLQAFLQRYWSTPITMSEVSMAERVCAAHGVPFNREGWNIILNECDGYLPLKIRAVPEGTPVPVKNVLVTVHNTNPRVPWLTSWAETQILRAVWYGSSVATVSRSIKRVIKDFLEETGDPAGLPFKLHDFGARGVSSPESAGIGGAAHLVNFAGTDTMEALEVIMDYYDDLDQQPFTMAGFSIPASEHSTMTSWGREGELDAFRNMIKQNGKPGALFACVSDSYNIWAALDMWKQLEPEILASGGTLVVRPDSGDPVDTPVRVAQRLIELFGSTTNSKGYRVLPDHIRVIQGDGVDLNSITEILTRLRALGISADNIAFGMGGALLQKVNRDTQKWTMKCSAVVLANGEVREVFKDPISDPGKASKRGVLDLVRDEEGNHLTTVVGPEPVQDAPNSNSELVTVFCEGTVLNNTNITEIRKRAEL